MCKKTPAVIYFYKKVSTTKKSELYEQLKDSPLSAIEFSFMCDVVEGLDLMELSEKYHKTYSRMSQWKRECCEKIHAFDLANITR